MSSSTTDKLIKDYEIKLVEPGCTPGAGQWGVQVNVPEDISAVFPYLNAVFNNTWYDHDNRILILREQNQAYALRPNEIRIARTEDPTHAHLVTADIVERINRIWEERDNIPPRYTEKRLPAVIEIFKLLPKTNCKKCGYLTCLAYAADLCQGEVGLEACPCLAETEYAENRKKIEELFTLE